jgi:hypothetical protein
LDIGLDLSRSTRGNFYAAEVSLLKSFGYAQRVIGTMELNDGTSVKIYQWVRVF